MVRSSGKRTFMKTVGVTTSMFLFGCIDQNQQDTQDEMRTRQESSDIDGPDEPNLPERISVLDLYSESASLYNDGVDAHFTGIDYAADGDFTDALIEFNDSVEAFSESLEKLRDAINKTYEFDEFDRGDEARELISIQQDIVQYMREASELFKEDMELSIDGEYSEGSEKFEEGVNKTNEALDVMERRGPIAEPLRNALELDITVERPEPPDR